jgi:hypothetical protein
MFVGMARSLSKSGAHERYFTGVGSNLTNKHLTKLERYTRDKTL